MKKYIEIMAKCQKAFGAALLAACLFFIALQIFSGYVEIEVPWAKRMAVSAMIWGVFTESGALVYDRAHFAFRGFSGRIKNERIAAAWDILVSFVKMIFSLLAIYYGVKLSAGAEAGTVNEFLNRGHIWMCLPLFGITSLIYLFCQTACDISRLKKGGNGI